MPRGKKIKKKEPKRRQEFEKQKDRGEDSDRQHSTTEHSENLAFVLKNDELHELRKILQKKDLADVPLLLGAVALGKFDIVKRLLRNGYAIDCCCCQDQSTPLMWAAKSKSIEMIDLLVRRGANVSLADEKGDNAILIALQSPIWDQDTFLDFWNSVKDNENFDPNHCNKAGYTMLHYAIKNQWEVLLESLLEKGVNVNCTTNKGVTPLMMAGSRNHCSMVRALLRANADIVMEDERGCTALCYSIAFMMQKRLDSPQASLARLISTLNDDETSITIEDYLKRRLDLLKKPPDLITNFADVISNVLLSVLGFFLRYIQDGVELLLEQKVFYRITDATEHHMEDADYTHALLAVMFELVRYCDCCFGGGMTRVTEAELMNAFIDGGAANICISILKFHGTSPTSSWILAAALMPLFIVCSVEGKSRAWLQAHHKEIQPFYSRFLNMCMVTYNFNADEYHICLVKKKIKIFCELMTKLRNGESIVVKQKSYRNKGVGDSNNHNSDNRSHRPSPVKSHANENDEFKDQVEKLNFDDLHISLATCSKKMRRKVAKSLRMKMTKLRSEVNSKNGENANVQALTPSIPQFNNQLSLSVVNKNPDKEIHSEKLSPSQFLNTNVSREKKNIETVNLWPVVNTDWDDYKECHKIVENDKTELEGDSTNDSSQILNYDKQDQTDSSDSLFTHYSKNTGHIETKVPVDIFVAMEEGKCKNMSESESNDECEDELETSLDISDSQTLTAIPSSNQSNMNESETVDIDQGFLEQKDKYDKIAMCLKAPIGKTPPPPFPNLQHKTLRDMDNLSGDSITPNDVEDDLAIKFVEDVQEQNPDNCNKDDPDAFFDFSQLEALFQEVILKYEKMWKQDLERDYPGHKCSCNKKNCCGCPDDENLKTLKNFLPKLEQDYLNRLAASWQSLSVVLKKVENKEVFQSIAHRLKGRLMDMKSHADYKLTQMTVDSAQKNQYSSEIISNESESSLVNLDTVINKNEENCKNHFTEFPHLGSNNFLHSTSTLLQDDDKGVIIESTKPGENCQCEEESIFADCSMLENTAVRQKYDSAYAGMSLEDCITAYINQTDKECNDADNEDDWSRSEPLLPKTTVKKKKVYTKSMKNYNTHYDIEEFFISQEGEIQSIAHDNGNSAFNTMTAAVRDPEYFYRKNAKIKQVSLEDFLKDERKSNNLTVVKFPALDFPELTRSEPLHETKSNLASATSVKSMNFISPETKLFHTKKSNISQESLVANQMGLAHLIKSQKLKQVQTISSTSPLQLSISIPTTDLCAISSKDRTSQMIKLSSGCSAISRWSPLVTSFHALNSSDRQTVGRGALTIAAEFKRYYYKLAKGGNFGDVELGVSAEGHPMAVKRNYQNVSICNPELCLLLQMTVLPLLAVKDIHIVQYSQCILENDEMFLATPLCEYNLGEYLMYLKVNNTLNTQATSLVKQFLSGLQYLHTRIKPIVHGNLKPSNILIDDKGVLKLSDFGLSQVLYKYVSPPKSAQIWWSRETYETYELKWCIYCTLKSDIQVAGMLIHFILTGGLHPFGAYTKDIIYNVAKGSPSLKTAGCEVNDLISWMLVFEPHERPVIADVFRHVYFWDMNKKWQFLLACTGITHDCRVLPLPLTEFHNCLDARAAADHVKGDWVSVVKANFPHMAPVDSHYSDTPTGLLRFIRACVEDQYNNGNSKMPSLHQFFLSAFPALPLSLYRLLEETEWLSHPVLACFTASSI